MSLSKPVTTWIETRPTPNGQFRATVYRSLDSGDALRRDDPQVIAVSDHVAETAIEAEYQALRWKGNSA